MYFQNYSYQKFKYGCKMNIKFVLFIPVINNYPVWMQILILHYILITVCNKSLNAKMLSFKEIKYACIKWVSINGKFSTRCSEA